MALHRNVKTLSLFAGRSLVCLGSGKRGLKGKREGGGKLGKGGRAP